MSIAGPKNAGTIVDDAALGDVAWTNPGSAGSSNDMYAQVDLTTGQTTHWLKATNFGFTLPLDARINAIFVEIEKRESGAWVEDASVMLVVLDTIGYSDGSTPLDLFAAVQWPEADAYSSYGGLTGDLGIDNWGLAQLPLHDEVSAERINRSDFGVAIRAICQSGPTTALIDHVRMTVYYEGSNRIASQAGNQRINAGGMTQSDFVS